jgi:hypothetical protein
MKTLNVPFTDQEIKELKQAKGLLTLNWHDLILAAIPAYTQVASVAWKEVKTDISRNKVLDDQTQYVPDKSLRYQPKRRKSDEDKS